MTLKIDKKPFWNQSLTYDLRQGWPERPADGTKLGRLQVMATVPDGEIFEYRTLSFRGTLNYFKTIFHNDDPVYDFAAATGSVAAYDIPVSDIPLEVLEAFENPDVDSPSRW